MRKAACRIRRHTGAPATPKGWRRSVAAARQQHCCKPHAYSTHPEKLEHARSFVVVLLPKVQYSQAWHGAAEHLVTQLLVLTLSPLLYLPDAQALQPAPPVPRAHPQLSSQLVKMNVSHLPHA